MKNKATTDKKVLLALLFVVFVWGLDFVEVEYPAAHMSTALLAAVKMSLVGVALLIIGLATAVAVKE